jgi:hypothetical protein
MLLIECPWCGERAETEFSYGGEAGIEIAVIPGGHTGNSGITPRVAADGSVSSAIP